MNLKELVIVRERFTKLHHRLNQLEEKITEGRSTTKCFGRVVKQMDSIQRKYVRGVKK